MWGLAAWIGVRYHGACQPGRQSSARRQCHRGDGDDVDESDEDGGDDGMIEDVQERRLHNQ